MTSKTLICNKRLLCNLFERLQALHSHPFDNPDECLAIQQVLAERITYFERRIRTIKQEEQSHRTALGTKQRIRLTKKQANELRASIRACERAIEDYTHLIYILRSIGDGLAFTYFAKWDIKPMSTKEGPGFISGKKGLRGEKLALRVFSRAGGIPIWNDVTNSLRHGDITMLGPEGQKVIIEIKSGTYQSRRVTRQATRLDALADYLNTDRAVSFHKDGYTSIRVLACAEERDHIAELNKGIDQALTHGSSFLKVEEGQTYFILASRHHLEGNADTGTFLESARNSLVLPLNWLKYSNEGYYPFTLSIANPEALFRFYCDDLLIALMLNRKVMEDKLTLRGFSLAFQDNPDFAFDVGYDDKNKAERFGRMGVTGVGFARFAAEFTSLDWFLQQIIYEMENAETILQKAGS